MEARTAQTMKNGAITPKNEVRKRDSGDEISVTQ